MTMDFFNFGDQWEAARWTLVAISLLAASGYQMLESQPANTLRTFLKTASISTLVPLPLLSLGGASSLVLLALALALTFGSAGDYFLSLKDGDTNTKRGILAFLVGHIFYLVVMVPHIGAPTLLQIIDMVFVIIIAVGTCLWVSPKLGAYKMPVLVYMGVITVMALVALTLPNPLTGLGALLFVFSDAVIVVNQFAHPVPARGPIVWITYYAAQCLVGMSLLVMLAG